MTTLDLPRKKIGVHRIQCQDGRIINTEGPPEIIDGMSTAKITDKGHILWSDGTSGRVGYLCQHIEKRDVTAWLNLYPGKVVNAFGLVARRKDPEADADMPDHVMIVWEVSVHPHKKEMKLEAARRAAVGSRSKARRTIIDRSKA